MKKRVPFVIALPGIASPDEESRIDTILKELKREEIYGRRVEYVQKTATNEQDEYFFNFDETAENIQMEIEMSVRFRNANPEKIGIISNSTSAIPVTKFLRNFPETKVKCYVSISPLLGWNYFLSPEQRNSFLTKGNGIPISPNGKKVKAPHSKLLPAGKSSLGSEWGI